MRTSSSGTCFETFLGADGESAYREWNFAPSGEWAAYDFIAYREGRTDADAASPYVRIEDNLTWWALGATIAVPAGPRWQLGLSAILEEKDGTKSYWALAHPDGDKPDFHDPVCFAARSIPGVGIRRGFEHCGAHAASPRVGPTRSISTHCARGWCPGAP